MPKTTQNPFRGAAPKSVPLPNTPLTGVLVQIRFPEVFSIAKKEYVADFQERIRTEYPRSQEEQSTVINIGPEGTNQKTTPNWRFFDDTMTWRVSLTTSFISIETRAYKNREDFTQRIGQILSAASESIQPSGVQRIGVRFVNRLPSALLQNIDEYVDKKILGFSNPETQQQLHSSMHESLFDVEEGKLLARWGMMPEKQSHDQDVMPQIDEKSWFLDTDVFQEFEPTLRFDAANIEKRSHELASRAYAFFRSVTTEKLLKMYGGNI